MDDVKDKVKGLMKKVNNPFSSNSSSGKFKGQGRTLGSSDAPPTNPIRPRPPNPTPLSPPSASKPTSPPPPPPSDPEISHSTTSPSDGLDSSTPTAPTSNPKLSACITTFISGGASVEVILKLFKNIVKEPENPKFRKVRLSNPKIREAVVEVAGGVELLECVGFELKEEGDEMWAVISDVPSEEEICLIKQAVSLLEPQPELPLGFSVRRSATTLETEERSLGNSVGVSPSMSVNEPELPQNIDRQVRVFFSTPGSITPKIDLPDSFYSLSAIELKREADARKKQLAESQLLIPKSYKEKKAKDARKKYKATVIRIQFPDEVVLQGVFLPWEPTTALYEFVSSSLKQPCLEFELWQPAVPKPRMIPRFPPPRAKTPTLDEEDLVPSALIKFKPIETDSVVFTGLSNELLESSESLTNKPLVAPA